jgi:hypothetical protein
MNNTFLPKDLIHIILEYGIDDYYTLDEWVDEEKLSFTILLNENPKAIHYITNIYI